MVFNGCADFVFALSSIIQGTEEFSKKEIIFRRRQVLEGKNTIDLYKENNLG